MLRRLRSFRWGSERLDPSLEPWSFSQGLRRRILSGTMETIRKLSLLLVSALLTVLAACTTPRADDSGVVEVRDVALTHVGATFASEQVNKELSGNAATVSPNLRNNSLIVIGNPEQMQSALEVIQRVDVPRN